MKIKLFLQLITLFFGLCWNTVAQANLNIKENEARSWALSKGEEVLQILAEQNLAVKYEALDKILHEDIDLDYAAKFVVGKYWRTMTEDQQQRYIPLFKRYTESLYKGYPLSFGEGMINYTVDNVVADKNTMNVWCSISLAQPQNINNENTLSFSILFMLVKNNNHIQIRDLKIAGSSLLLSYRDRFYKMIHEDNDDEIDWFLEDLQSITNDNEQKNEQKLDAQ